MSHLTRRLSRRTWHGAALALLFAAAGSLLISLPESANETRSVRSIRVTDRHGQLLREVRPEGRGIPVELNLLPPFVPQAVVATEDRFFYRHPGVDLVAAARAATQLVRSGRVVSGASTITMQVARLIRGRAGPRWLDKLAEVHLALRLELRMTKEEILTLWLNRAYFGSQAYGIEAAARTYFGKHAEDLALAEGALLVGLAQSPSMYDPFRRPDLALQRRDYVLAAMERSGFLTGSERQQQTSLPVDLSHETRIFDAPHLVERVAAGELASPTPPLEIRTTIDRGLQRDATALARAHLATLEDMKAGNAAILVVDNVSGDVLAYVGNPEFWDEQTEGQNDGVQMLRQPGSALKPFTYGHALRSRSYTAASILADVETPVLEAGGAFSPANYDRRFHGPVPLRTALASSYNVPAVRLARQFGPEVLLETLHDAGFESLTRSARRYGVGLTLGNGEVSLEELAQAYAGLAGGGVAPSLRFELSRRSAIGEIDRIPSRAQSIGLGEDVAYILSDILSDPRAREPAFGRGGPLELPFPCAVKTGTSKNYRDNWAVGYTPKHTVAVWVGNFDGTPMRTVAGVSGAGTLLKSVFLLLGPGGAFEMPTSVTQEVICPVSGRRPSRICPTRRSEIFLRGTAPRDTCDVHQRFALDVRTGTLAMSETPIEFIAEQVFEVQPPIFHEWMREQGIALPPGAEGAEVLRSADKYLAEAETARGTEVEPIEAVDKTSGRMEDHVHAYHARATADDSGIVVAQGDADDRVAADGTQTTSTERLLISYPESGMVFQMDAVLRKKYQRFEPRGSATQDLTNVEWWLDGDRLDQSFDGAQIPLEPGRHVLQMRARDGDGRLVNSREVVFVVLGLEPIADAAGVRSVRPVHTISTERLPE
jgi:penicillin-binding protein 1C